MWYNVHDSKEPCENGTGQIACLQANLACAVFIGRMPVNEEARGFRVCTAYTVGHRRYLGRMPVNEEAEGF